MTVSTAARPSRPVGHDPLRGGLRVLAELVAWVAVPWALWPHSPVLAIAAVLVLVVPPAVFGTPGDRPGGDPPVAGPGRDGREARGGRAACLPSGRRTGEQRRQRAEIVTTRCSCTYPSQS